MFLVRSQYALWLAATWYRGPVPEVRASDGGERQSRGGLDTAARGLSRGWVTVCTVGEQANVDKRGSEGAARPGVGTST